MQRREREEAGGAGKSLNKEVVLAQQEPGSSPMWRQLWHRVHGRPPQRLAFCTLLEAGLPSSRDGGPFITPWAKCPLFCRRQFSGERGGCESLVTSIYTSDD